MLLYWLTLAVVAAVVLVLAGYLVAIAWALWRAKRNVAQIADALEEIAGLAAPLEEKVTTIAGALDTVNEGFARVDERLGEAAGAFGL